MGSLLAWKDLWLNISFYYQDIYHISAIGIFRNAQMSVIEIIDRCDHKAVLWSEWMPDLFAVQMFPGPIFISFSIPKPDIVILCCHMSPPLFLANEKPPASSFRGNKRFTLFSKPVRLNADIIKESDAIQPSFLCIFCFSQKVIKMWLLFDYL